MAIYEYRDKRPVIGEGSWVAENAMIIGDVTIGKNCWIGPNAVIRADFGTVIIGDNTAIEDGAVIHTPRTVTIGSHVTVGHLAMIHNRLVKDYAVVGMKSTLGDDAEVGMWSIVAEHSLIKKNQVVPDYKLYAGVPAVEKGDITEHHQEIMKYGKLLYVELTRHYKTSFKKIG